jgi:hypothetical protein
MNVYVPAGIAEHLHGRCASCGAPVWWAISTNGRPMPVDFEPVDGGNIDLAWDDDARALTATVIPHGQLDMFDRPRYRTHFVSCPHADQWRR